MRPSLKSLFDILDKIQPLIHSWFMLVVFSFNLWFFLVLGMMSDFQLYHWTFWILWDSKPYSSFSFSSLSPCWVVAGEGWVSVYVASHWALSTLSQQKWHTESHQLIAFRWGGSSALPSALLISPQWNWGSNSHHLFSSVQMCKLSFLLNSTATGGVDGRCDILFYCCRMDKEAQLPTGSYYLKGGESRVLTSPPPTPSFHFVDVSGGGGSAAHWVYSHMGWRDWSTDISTSHHPHQSHWCHMGPHQHWRGTRVGQNQRAN